MVAYVWLVKPERFILSFLVRRHRLPTRDTAVAEGHYTAWTPSKCNWTT